ncbi:hypothetical protein ACK8GG_06360 [Micromonosporaceae bacterium DT55]|uniref:hypothetical protein n=1 Tax=Melissospora conviva TaxID=3388432 RepID=UPI003C2515DA
MPQPQPRAGSSVSLSFPAHRVVTALAAVSLAVGLAGCSAPNRTRTSTEYSDSRYQRSEIGDCDAEDRRDQEMPDCGRLVNGVYQEWDWVRAGRLTPPTGWSPPRQQPPGYVPPPTTGRSTGGSSTGTTGGSSTGTTAGSPAGGTGSDAAGSGRTTSGGTRPAPRPRTGRR